MRNPFEAAQIDGEAIRAGARAVKALHAADFAEQVACDLCVEAVLRKSVCAAHELKVRRGHNDVHRSLHRADRAIAAQRLELAHRRLERHRAAVTSSANHFCHPRHPLSDLHP
eukprot:CAMPEP_0185833894 /NCGR_PEP_ID=MMETSP1353-20130828/3638_1 /TAXON_ID=1077150 /ORGANISM="Erythrolobus australicus, Strain CCMP3124" /LENGTH=112 /DNA_ID=CAMNT_0028532233 /DNA_START=319 /DNA_END=654 /DNA_ORIENTATION=-